jgi:hypothetical protein
MASHLRTVASFIQIMFFALYVILSAFLLSRPHGYTWHPHTSLVLTGFNETDNL